MAEEKTFTEYRISFFAALCLFLAAVEYAIPKPFPFLRLGLANLPVLLAARKFNFKEYVLLVLFKVLGQALISGTLFSYVFLFSAAGSVASALVMYLLSRGQLFSCVGISLAGALANNCAQLLCARFIMFGENAKYIAPVLLICGFVSGILLGVFAQCFVEKSQWLKNASVCGKDEASVDNSAVSVEKGTDSEENTSVTVNSRISVEKGCGIVEKLGTVLLFAVMIGFLFLKSVPIVWGCVVLFYIFAMIKRKGRVKLMPSVFITLTVTVFALFNPFGRVLFTLGKFRITEGALLSGLHRSGILCGMVFLSQIFVSKRIKLPGKAGVLVSNVFIILDTLGQKRIKFEKGKIIESIDNRLCEIWNKERGIA